MAEHVEDTQRVLRQCASTLLSAVSRLGSSTSISTSGPSTSSSGQQQNPVSLTHSTPVSNALQEHRRLFGFQPQTSNARRGATSTARGKRRKVEKPQWSHTFVCLGKVDDEIVPSFIEKGTLAIAGLGERKIAFPPGKGCKVLMDALEGEFPKLKQGGGFEILRNDGRFLRVIPPPPGGYTVEYLRGTLNQAKGYIRPLQRNLSEEAITSEESDDSFTVECVNCSKHIPCNEFRAHQISCTVRSHQSHICSSTRPSSSSHSGTFSQDITVADQIERDREFAEQLLQTDEDDQVHVLMNSTEKNAADTPSSTLQEALQQIKKSVTSHRKSDEFTSFYVQRSRVWKNVFEELKTSELSTCNMSVEFIGESAVDTGGPTRELFSLVYQQVMAGKLTRGSSPSLTFMHDQGALMAGEYRALGQLIALAFLNEANGPHFFSPTVAHYMLGINSDTDPYSMVDEIPVDQWEIKDKLRALLHCEDPNSWDEAILQFEERFDMGITKAKIPIEEKNDVIKATNRHIMVSSVAEEIFSFQEGLAAFGVLDALKAYPDESVKLFVYAQVSVEDIRKTFLPMFSISGSSKRQCEETIVFNFYQFLKQCDKGNVQRKFIEITTLESEDEEIPEIEQTLTLQHVLQFLTGARNKPLGSIEGSIVFVHDGLKGARVKANTCALQLTIPVNDRYFSEASATFISNFADDIFDGQGYGLV